MDKYQIVLWEVLRDYDKNVLERTNLQYALTNIINDLRIVAETHSLDFDKAIKEMKKPIFVEISTNTNLYQIIKRIVALPIQVHFNADGNLGFINEFDSVETNEKFDDHDPELYYKVQTLYGKFLQARLASQNCQSRITMLAIAVNQEFGQLPLSVKVDIFENSITRSPCVKITDEFGEQVRTFAGIKDLPTFIVKARNFWNDYISCRGDNLSKNDKPTNIAYWYEVHTKSPIEGSKFANSKQEAMKLVEELTLKGFSGFHIFYMKKEEINCTK